jgi:hypothetical protein
MSALRDVRRRDHDGAWLDRCQHAIEVGEPGHRADSAKRRPSSDGSANPDQVEAWLPSGHDRRAFGRSNSADHGNG